MVWMIREMDQGCADHPRMLELKKNQDTTSSALRHRSRGAGYRRGAAHKVFLLVFFWHEFGVNEGDVGGCSCQGGSLQIPGI